MQDATEIRTLIEQLRTALAFAAAGGAPPDFVAGVADQTVQALTELDSWRRGDQDPRCQASISRGRYFKKLRAGGLPITQIADQHGLSRAQVYRLIKRVA